MPFTLDVLQDQYRHLEWAESRLWGVALDLPAATTDRELIDKLHHIHSTQRAFLDVWLGRELGAHWKLVFASLREVYAFARPYYAEAHAFVAALDAAALERPTPLPWARMFAKVLGRDPAVSTLGETLYQVVAHSSYHRAQANTRLRALAATPPLVDYIAWIWEGRPVPAWTTDNREPRT